MQKIILILPYIREKMTTWIIYLLGSFVFSALIVSTTLVILDITGFNEVATQINREFIWRFDDTFKNSSNSIYQKQDGDIWVAGVVNNVKIGKLAGNRQLEFGVKNILEEFLQEKDYELSPASPNKLKVEIVYLDVLTTKKNVSVFHKNEEEVVIRMKGILLKDNVKINEVLVEESSSEISMSTLIIDQGGKFNQTSLSNAIKKACDKLVTKLTEK